jgi:hypothetical protein
MNLSDIKVRSEGKEKENQDRIIYGNKDGQIEFGHIHLSNDNLDSNVTSGVYLQAYDSRHYMTMDIDGIRKGWTLNRCPGSYEILCGTETKERDIGFFLFSENGDIVIRAPKGRIRLSALDIDIRASGEDNTRGSVNIDSNQSVNIKTGSFDVKANVGINIFTPYTLNMIANTTLNITSNFVNSLTSASRIYPNKDAIPAQSVIKFNLNSNYFS